MSKVRKITLSTVLVLTWLLSFTSFAQNQPNATAAGNGQDQIEPTPTLSAVDWTSMNTSNKITVANTTQTKLLLFISVSTMNNPNAPGINIQNCGSVSHITAGSSVICPLKAIVTFSSDGGKIAYGSYQVMKP